VPGDRYVQARVAVNSGCARVACQAVPVPPDHARRQHTGASMTTFFAGAGLRITLSFNVFLSPTNEHPNCMGPLRVE